MLTIMAGFEVKDRNLVASLRDNQREEICTKRRRAIVKWAADSKSSGGFSLLCEMLGYSVDLDDATAVKDAEKYVQTRLNALAQRVVLRQGPGDDACLYGLVLGAQHPADRKGR